MRLKDVGMVLSPTPRSSAYLQALVRRRLFPSHVIVLETDSGQLLPGQLPPVAKDRLRSFRWLESSYFDPGVTVAQLIHENNLSYECLDHGINTVEVEAIIHRRPERIFVYSGTGGVILGERILSCGKRFLHAHAGALPAYRGSTTVYYSILQDDRCHASVIIMEPKIDCGRVVRTESYPKPRNGEIIDYVYDPYIRSDVLVKVLEEYAATGELPQRRQEPADAETYFIIHPVLKHLAILSCGE